MTKSIYAFSKDQLNLYLNRIGITERPSHTVTGLQQLGSAHFFSIPFENLGSHLKEKDDLQIDNLFDKLVVRQRGGICYEQNLVLAAALGGLGFEYELLSGQMASRDGHFGPPFVHLTLRVFLNKEYLVDIGNGETFTAPLNFEGNWVPQERGGAYRIVTDGKQSYRVEQHMENNQVQTVYLFNGKPQEIEAFEPMWRFHSESPESHFARGWIATLPQANGGRLTVAKGMEMETTPKGMERRAIGSAQKLETILKEKFKMKDISIPQHWFK